MKSKTELKSVELLNELKGSIENEIDTHQADLENDLESEFFSGIYDTVDNTVDNVNTDEVWNTNDESLVGHISSQETDKEDEIPEGTRTYSLDMEWDDIMIKE